MGTGQLLLAVRCFQRPRWSVGAKYRGVGYAFQPRGTDSLGLSRRDQKSQAVRATSVRVGIEVLNRGPLDSGLGVRTCTSFGDGAGVAFPGREGSGEPASVHKVAHMNIINGCWLILGQPFNNICHFQLWWKFLGICEYNLGICSGSR